MWIVERVRFLDAIQTDAPEVLEDLAGMPFVLFEEIAREHGVEGAVDWFTQPDSPALEGDTIPLLLMPIKAWAHQWHVDTAWMREVAVRTVTDWYERTPGYTPDAAARRHFSGLFHAHAPLLKRCGSPCVGEWRAPDPECHVHSARPARPASPGTGRPPTVDS
jgi:hypothetical protein